MAFPTQCTHSPSLHTSSTLQHTYPCRQDKLLVAHPHPRPRASKATQQSPQLAFLLINAEQATAGIDVERKGHFAVGSPCSRHVPRHMQPVLPPASPPPHTVRRRALRMPTRVSAGIREAPTAAFSASPPRCRTTFRHQWPSHGSWGGRTSSYPGMVPRQPPPQHQVIGTTRPRTTLQRHSAISNAKPCTVPGCRAAGCLTSRAGAPSRRNTGRLATGAS